MKDFFNKNLLKEILIILLSGIILGLIINLINPKGVPLVMDMRKYSMNEEDTSRKVPFWNDPYDTSSNKPPQMLQDVEYTKEGYVKPQNISLNIAKLLFEHNALFIDGRKKEEFDAGHIKGAINIPYEDFYKKTQEEKIQTMKKFNKQGIIVVYCDGGSCDISIDLAYEFARIDFTSLNIFREGYIAWEKAGYPTETTN